MSENNNWSALPQLVADLDIIQKLDDEPNDVGGLTAAELKAKFDEAANTIKTYLNGTLLPAIQTAGEADEEDVGEEIANVQESITSIQDALAGKQNTLTFDAQPTYRSDNALTSGVIYEALGQKLSRDIPVRKGEGLNALVENTTGGIASGSSTGDYCHVEGYLTKATGDYSHSEGEQTEASGAAAHAEGCQTVANHRAQHVFGMYNELDPSGVATDAKGNYVEIVGNGTPSERSNARTLDWDGNEVLAGKLTLGAGPVNSMDAATKAYVDSQSGGGGVSSFNGRSGAVTPQSGDYTAAQVGADQAGAAADVQANLDTHDGNTIKHITAAERAAWNGKAPLASPSFTGAPVAPTPTLGDDSTKIATTAFVNAAVSAAIGTAIGGAY